MFIDKLITKIISPKGPERSTLLEKLEKNYLTKKKRSLDFIEGPFEKLNDFKELNDFEQLQQEFPLDPVSEVKESVYVNDSEIDTEYDIKKLTKV